MFDRLLSEALIGVTPNLAWSELVGSPATGALGTQQTARDRALQVLDHVVRNIDTCEIIHCAQERGDDNVAYRQTVFNHCSRGANFPLVHNRDYFFAPPRAIASSNGWDQTNMPGLITFEDNH